jgi:hypothetical protein
MHPPLPLPMMCVMAGLTAIVAEGLLTTPAKYVRSRGFTWLNFATAFHGDSPSQLQYYPDRIIGTTRRH